MAFVRALDEVGTSSARHLQDREKESLSGIAPGEPEQAFVLVLQRAGQAVWFHDIRYRLCQDIRYI